MRPADAVATRIDTSDIKTTSGDYNLADLSARVDDYLPGVADEACRLAADRRKWLAFTATVANAGHLVALLAARGIEALRDGVVQTIRGNPMGIALGAAGVGALVAARGLGSSIAEGGGRGAGSQAAPVTNNNVSVRVVAPNGMTSDQAAYVSAAAEEGARRGLRQDRR